MYKILILIILLFTFTNLKSQIDSTKIDSISNVKNNEIYPDPDEFVSIEKEVSYSYEDLQRSIEYPEEFRRKGIEGLVMVQAFIGKDGLVKKAQVSYSDNELLNKSTINAVLNFKGFTPAVNKNKTIGVWITIPFKFKLN